MLKQCVIFMNSRIPCQNAVRVKSKKLSDGEIGKIHVWELGDGVIIKKTRRVYIYRLLDWIPIF